MKQTAFLLIVYTNPNPCSHQNTGKPYFTPFECNADSSSIAKQRSKTACIWQLHQTERRVTQCEAKEKYQGMFEIQKSGNKTTSAEIGLDIRTHAIPKVGQDHVPGGEGVLCWHAARVAYVLWKPCTIR